MYGPIHINQCPIHRKQYLVTLFCFGAVSSVTASTFRTLVPYWINVGTDDSKRTDNVNKFTLLLCTKSVVVKIPPTRKSSAKNCNVVITQERTYTTRKFFFFSPTDSSYCRYESTNFLCIHYCQQFIRKSQQLNAVCWSTTDQLFSINSNPSSSSGVTN